MGGENTTLAPKCERPLPTPKCSIEGLTFTVDSCSPWNEGKFLAEIEDDVNWAEAISRSTLKSQKKIIIIIISQV